MYMTHSTDHDETQLETHRAQLLRATPNAIAVVAMPALGRVVTECKYYTTFSTSTSQKRQSQSPSGFRSKPSPRKSSG